MCVILVAGGGTPIETGAIKNAIKRNPDGWGLAIVFKQSYKVIKGFGEQDAVKAVENADVATLRVFHARVSTQGKVDIENAHPYDATYNGQARLLFHNGCLRNLPEFDKTKSDSWHFAQMLKGFPTEQALLDTMDDYAKANNSRFVFVSTKPPGRSKNPQPPQYYAWMLGKGWITQDGVSYSNLSALTESEPRKAVATRGGLLKVGTTSKEFVYGWEYDAQKKLYTYTGKRPEPEVHSFGGHSAYAGKYWDSRTKTWVEYGHTPQEEATWVSRRFVETQARRCGLLLAESFDILPTYIDGKPYRRYVAEKKQWIEFEKQGNKTVGQHVVDGPYPDTVQVSSKDIAMYFVNVPAPGGIVSMWSMQVCEVYCKTTGRLIGYMRSSDALPHWRAKTIETTADKGLTKMPSEQMMAKAHKTFDYCGVSMRLNTGGAKSILPKQELTEQSDELSDEEAIALLTDADTPEEKARILQLITQSEHGDICS
jgi:hypothetical protein